MDPQACWVLLCGNLLVGDFEDAGNNAADLFGWLGKGGFAPISWARLDAGERTRVMAALLALSAMGAE